MCSWLSPSQMMMKRVKLRPNFYSRLRPNNGTRTVDSLPDSECSSGYGIGHACHATMNNAARLASESDAIVTCSALGPD